MELLWMVWKSGGGAPTAVHTSLASAKREAERLALTVGGTFCVMQMVAWCRKPTVEWGEASAPHGDGCNCNNCIPF